MMMLAGDEFARTQNGNNNAYCQDNEISWINWNIQEEGQSLIGFVGKLTVLRHKYPILHRSRFLTGVYNEELGVKDVTWINASGVEMKPEEWGDMTMQCFGMLMDGRAQPTGIRRRGEDATLLMVLNAYHDLVEFSLPETPGGSHWQLLIDTNLADHDKLGTFATGEAYGATGRSLLLFALESDTPAKAAILPGPAALVSTAACSAGRA
jgi:glycogen operon protein